MPLNGVTSSVALLAALHTLSRQRVGMAEATQVARRPSNLPRGHPTTAPIRQAAASTPWHRRRSRSRRAAGEDVPGIGNIAGERCSSQANEIWLAVALRRSRERRVWARKPTRCKRVPRNKGDTSFAANVDQPVGGSIPEIVAVLDGHDWGHSARSGELPLLSVAQAATRAGYSAKTAREIGHQNLTKLDIAAAIEKARAKRAEPVVFRASSPGRCVRSKAWVNLSRSLAALDQESTLIAVIEMSRSTWLVAGIVPGINRQPLKKLAADETALLQLLCRWRDEATKAGRTIDRIAVAYEAGRDGFWLARGCEDAASRLM